MSERPVKMSLVDDRLEIEWSDGQVLVYDPGELRQACPCATCKSERPENEVPPGPVPPAAIRQMLPVGNYAYNIVFADGHRTGIYPLDMLRELGQPL